MSRPDTSHNLILLPAIESKENFLAGFWRWVECLSSRDYRRAFESIYWPGETSWWRRKSSWTPAALEKAITRYVAGPEPGFAIVPNERLVGVVNTAAEYRGATRDDKGWLMAQIPVTNSKLDPKDDAIPLLGMGVSFFVLPHREHYVLSLEIFHL